MRKYLVRSTLLTVIATSLLIGATIESSGASPKKLTAGAELLVKSDLPYGWSMHTVRSDYGVGCLKPLASARGLDFTTRASRTFIDDGNPPELTEVLALSKSPATLYKSVIASLGKCHVVKGYFAKHRIKGSVVTLSFHHYGAASHTYVAKAKAEGALLSEDVVVIQTSHAVIAIAEGNEGSVSLSQFNDFIGASLRRVKGVRAEHS